jgi:16S rRNA (guanine(966)-N(2))-methyltransferase RsmD
MRITGGELGGRTLKAPRGLATRPTADRVRQALFNILSPLPAGARVLDLYAGSGALGIEALSRGAALAVFVEESPRAAAVLLANLADLGLSGRSQLLRLPVRRALRELQALAPFDLIFADPPYQAGLLPDLLTQLGGPWRSLIREGGLVIVEHLEKQALLPTYGELARADHRCYGQTALSFYAPRA